MREDRATGRGSAIIALPDGRQQSFAVGDEIMPGRARWPQVGFDNVTINRGGTPEQIFLDQSTPAPAAGAPRRRRRAVASRRRPPPPPPAAPPASPADPLRRVSPAAGSTASSSAPGGDGGQAFRGAGFDAGDVIVAVNGQRVTSLEQARAAMRARAGNVTVMVDRGGRAVPLRVRLNP